MLDLPGPSGGQVLNLALAASLLGIAVGFGLWETRANIHANKASNLTRAMKALAIAVLLALLAGLMGWWLPGILSCVVAILLLVIILRLSVEG